jgi:hypothetical protein
MQSFKNPFPNINLKSISTKEIENLTKSLKIKNSSGYEGISTKLIKISSPFISSPLTHTHTQKRVKQSRYRPGVAQRVPGS